MKRNTDQECSSRPLYPEPAELFLVQNIWGVKLKKQNINI